MAADPTPPIPPQLVVLSGPYRGDVIVLDDTIPVVFGSRAGVRLPEPALDAVHCQVFTHDGAWLLQDFGSEAGTWLGDDRVLGVRPLPFGRAFRIGETHVGLIQPDARAPATDSAEIEQVVDSTELEPPPTATPGSSAEEILPENVGIYTIRRLLGSGPLGRVYEAFDPRRRRPVALKLLAPQLCRDKQAVTRFLRGAKACGRLKHPNLVAIQAAGHTKQRIYVATEYVDGDDLEGVCETAGGKLSPREAVALLSGVAEGLAYLHERGVLHRNVKPTNVLIGPGRWAKLGDPSLAKREQAAGELSVTGPKDVLVTSGYAPPEATYDAQHVDARADVFALGATLYRALTGSPPFTPDDPSALVTGNFTDPREHAPGVSPALVKLLTRTLQPQPDDRYQTVLELRDALLDLPETRLR